MAIAEELLTRGARVQAFDPAAMAEASRMLPSVLMCKDAYEACSGADALVIVTEWNQFRMLNLERVKSLLQEPILIDLRNIYQPAAMKQAGFLYLSVGR